MDQVKYAESYGSPCRRRLDDKGFPFGPCQEEVNHGTIEYRTSRRKLTLESLKELKSKNLHKRNFAKEAVNEYQVSFEFKYIIIFVFPC